MSVHFHEKKLIAQIPTAPEPLELQKHHTEALNKIDAWLLSSHNNWANLAEKITPGRVAPCRAINQSVGCM
jgi:hypothetical protein